MWSCDEPNNFISLSFLTLCPLIVCAVVLRTTTTKYCNNNSGFDCYQRQKWNELQPETLAIPGSEAIILILHDSTIELLSLICVGCLIQCLRLPQGDFSSLPYRLSCTVIPIILSLYFPQASNNKHDRPTCVATSKLYDASLTTADLRDEAVPRRFPVVLVFHLVVSLSLWFMLYQNQQYDKNVFLLQKLKHDLTQTKTKDDNNNNKKKTDKPKKDNTKTKR